MLHNVMEIAFHINDIVRVVNIGLQQLHYVCRLGMGRDGMGALVGLFELGWERESKNDWE